MEYKCNICNKQYSSYQSLWIHNKKYHTTKNKNDSHLDSHDNQNDNHISSNKKTYKCSKCNKNFSCYQNRWRHEKKCESNDNEIMKQKIDELEKRLSYFENNKHSTKIINNVHGNMVNGNNNEIGPKLIIHKPGTENVKQLSDEEVKKIFNCEISSVIKLTELLNFNEKYPENHSFCSRNLESSYLSFYNTDTNTENKTMKKYFFENIICKSIQIHEILYVKYKNKIASNERKRIESNIASLKEIRDGGFNNKNLKGLIAELNVLSYNKKDLVLDTWKGKNINIINNKLLDNDGNSENESYCSDSDSVSSDSDTGELKPTKITKTTKNNEIEL